MSWRLSILAVLAALVFTVPAVAQDGLVGYWPMDEGSGDTVGDASGNGNDGTAQNTDWVQGKYDNALEFDGSISIVDIPYFAEVSPTEGTTISAWIFPTDTTRSCVAGQFEAYGMALNDGLQLKSVIWGDDWIEGGITAPMEEWSYLVMTWDVDNAERMIFLNSELVAERPNAVPVPQIQNNFGIGKWSGNHGWEDMFMGIIDDVKIWNRVLTADEVSEASDPSKSVKPHAKLATVWGSVKSSL